MRLAGVGDCDMLSDIHSGSFRRGWSEAEFEALLVQAGTFANLAETRGRGGRAEAIGFTLYRLLVDEAEIVSLAVTPAWRRRGVGRMLLEDALRHVYREGARGIHLEVEDANLAALALYRGLEFHETAKRSGYYAQGREKPAGAIVMLRQLREAPPALGGPT
jgi:ribosomal-protein-alanine N-acetyltransferase